MDQKPGRLRPEAPRGDAPAAVLAAPPRSADTAGPDAGSEPSRVSRVETLHEPTQLVKEATP
jgi:hypothetical protein